MPGTAAGTTPRKQSTVACAIRSADAWSGQPFPGMTMLGLSSVPWRSIPCSYSSSKVAWSVRVVTSQHTSSVLSPSISTSGSTIGTSPASWQRPA